MVQTASASSGTTTSFFVDAPVAERNRPPDPNAHELGGRDLVAHPLADHLALELGEGQEHVEREPAHAGGGVERLGDRHEGDPVLVERLDQLGEFGERAGEPVDLVDHDNVDLPGPDTAHTSL